MRRSLAACFVLAGALVSPSVAGAATITLNYTASAIVSSFPLGITPGDLVTGTLVFETNAIADFPSDTSLGRYQNAAVSLTINVGAHSGSNTGECSLSGMMSLAATRTINQVSSRDSVSE
jgi:hypothetical protein